MAKERSRKRSSFGIVFWIAVILLVAIVFLFNLPAIREVLDTTGFVEVVFEEHDQDLAGDEESEREVDSDPVVTEGADEDDSGTDSEEDMDPSVELDVPEEETGKEIVLEPPETSDDEQSPQQTRRTTLYFIRVSDDGRILAEPVQRMLRYSGGPLTAAVEALVAGPNADDLNKGLLSLIPSDTKLLSARVTDGVAYLNFNEAFRFNTMGLEGYLAQMQQITLTATAFSTVDSVQILINGQTVEYLGGDGVYVGEPLTPSDLRN